MMSSVACVAQAVRLDAEARQSGSAKLKAYLTEIAEGWRWVAALARKQEDWEAENPPGHF